MTDEELAELVNWLRQMHGIELEPAFLRDPAATAGAFGALAERAAASLPFGAEPSGFHVATAALTGPGGARPGGKQGNGRDAG